MTATKQPNKLVLGIGVIAILVACFIRFVLPNSPETIRTELSSTLMEAINIAELSTAEFRYKGIAEIYTNEEKTKIRCRVCYNAIVKAGIDMNEVKPGTVDPTNKTITMSLPNINLKVSIIDEQSMNTLPSDSDVSFNVLLKRSKEDVENEAKHSKELINTARENLKATIEGLAYPILKPQGYTIIWD